MSEVVGKLEIPVRCNALHLANKLIRIAGNGSALRTRTSLDFSEEEDGSKIYECAGITIPLENIGISPFYSDIKAGCYVSHELATSAVEREVCANCNNYILRKCDAVFMYGSDIVDTSSIPVMLDSPERRVPSLNKRNRKLSPSMRVNLFSKPNRQKVSVVTIIPIPVGSFDLSSEDDE